MQLSLKILSVVALPASLLGIALVAQEPEKAKKNDAKIVELIRGDYTLTGGTVEGNKMTADRIANVSVKITDQTITTYDGQREQRFGASYQILSDKRPWPILMKSVKKVSSDQGTKEKVEQSEGILDLSEDGQRLRLAYALDAEPRPKNFEGGKHLNVFELERLKKTEPPQQK